MPSLYHIFSRRHAGLKKIECKMVFSTSPLGTARAQRAWSTPHPLGESPSHGGGNRIVRQMPTACGGHLSSERTCKPGSVERDHLSRPTRRRGARALFTDFRGRAAHVRKPQTCIGRSLHGTACYHAVGELLPPLSTLTPRGAMPVPEERSISVALVLKSPSPDVIRRPAL